jgi:long-chain acyl-CoA synthetase
MPISTLAELFLQVAGQSKTECLLHKVGGRYQAISTAELVDRVRRLAKALKELGVTRGDRVALMAENGPHWPTIDFASLAIGAATVPIYPTLLPEGAAYVARDSGARVLFIDGRERYESLLALAGEMPAVEHYVLIDGESGSSGVTTIADLFARGAGVDATEFESWARTAQPDDLATLIYTSGTTGDPKGVMLTHRNIVSNIVDALKVLDIESGFVGLSFLPLSHSFERTVDYIYFYRGCTIAYAESIQTVAKNLSEVNPNVFVSVPRVYEKVMAKVLENVELSSGTKQKIFHWAVGVGKRALPWRLQAKRPPGLLGLWVGLADRLVFAKIRARLGNRFAFAISGGAPLARDLAEFFWGAGIPIFEGYGLTETSPVLTVNGWGAVRLGCVGRAIPNVELEIAEDGEILAKGPNIMKGYFNHPEATAESIDAAGWFHTGDIGILDEDGFLAITDRKKEIIVNAYGKNIAPAPIENALKASRFIGQAMIIGDRRKFISALLVPDFEALAAWAEREGVPGADPGALVAEPKVRALFGAEVDAVNHRLARYEQIHAWELVPQEFSIEGGELTPTQKIKRRVVNTKYKSLIDAMYATAGD